MSLTDWITFFHLKLLEIRHSTVCYPVFCQLHFLLLNHQRVRGEDWEGRDKPAGCRRSVGLERNRALKRAELSIVLIKPFPRKLLKLYLNYSVPSRRNKSNLSATNFRNISFFKLFLPFTSVGMRMRVSR